MRLSYHSGSLRGDNEWGDGTHDSEQVPCGHPLTPGLETSFTLLKSLFSPPIEHTLAQARHSMRIFRAATYPTNPIAQMHLRLTSMLLIRSRVKRFRFILTSYRS